MSPSRRRAPRPPLPVPAGARGRLPGPRPDLVLGPMPDPAPGLAPAVVVALLLALLTGCGVRLETPPPAALTPGVDEVARQRASADAVALEVLAGASGAAPGAPVDPADPVAVTRAAVAAEAATHLDLLGGLYDDGLDPQGPPRPGELVSPATTPGASTSTTPGASAAPGASPAPEPAAAPVEVVVTTLADAAATARTDLAGVQDGGLARLLGSLAASRLLSASRLATAAGLAPPPVPDVVVPDALPDGMTGSGLATLVAAEDAAGYALEVVAAKHTGDLRSRAGARAATHRQRAQAWAEAGEIDATGLDPRRVAYALPGGLEDPAAAAALVARVETTLAADYASLVGMLGPGAPGRGAVADAVAEATAQAVAWGAPLPGLPGLPEHVNR